jgi:hypothetical protein
MRILSTAKIQGAKYTEEATALADEVRQRGLDRDGRVRNDRGKSTTVVKNDKEGF